MDALSEVVGLRDGPQEVHLDQRDVVELRGAGGAGLRGARVQEHLTHTRRKTKPEGGSEKRKDEGSSQQELSTRNTKEKLRVEPDFYIFACKKLDSRFCFC